MGLLRRVFLLPDKKATDEEEVSRILDRMNPKQKEYLRRKLSDIAGDD